jgi:hypothetical protein
LAFVLLAAVVYYVVVMPVSKLVDRITPTAPTTPRECPFCLSKIPLTARRRVDHRAAGILFESRERLAAPVPSTRPETGQPMGATAAGAPTCFGGEFVRRRFRANASRAEHWRSAFDYCNRQ